MNASKSQSDDQLFEFLNTAIKWKPKRRVAQSDDIEENGCSSGARVVCDFEDIIINPYLCHAVDVIHFQIIFPKEIADLDEITKPFKVDMAHQVFGTDEVILGYRNLSINFSVLPNSFHTKLDYTYSSMLKNPLRGEIVDNIERKVGEWFPHLVKDDEFNKLQQSEELLKMFGDVIFETQLIDEENASTSIYITECDHKNEDFLSFHKRFQALIVFYIDAASIIDFSDPNWMYFYVYKDVVVGDKVLAKIPIGFCTVYKFVMSERGRVSQFFILPNYQQRGIGSRLLAVIYKQLRTCNDIKIINVEYPCEEFSMLRDKLDLKFIVHLPEFSREKILAGYSPNMAMAAKKLIKLCPEQVRHLVSILRCYYSQNDALQRNDLIKVLKKAVHLKYKNKLNRLICKAGNEFRIAQLKHVVHDDYMINMKIHKEVSAYVTTMSSHTNLIDALLRQTPQ